MTKLLIFLTFVIWSTYSIGKKHINICTFLARASHSNYARIENEWIFGSFQLELDKG